MFSTKDSNDDRESYLEMNSCTDTGRFPAASSGHTSYKLIETMLNQADMQAASVQQKTMRLPPKRPRSKHRQQKKDSGTVGLSKVAKESRMVVSNSESHYTRNMYSSQDEGTSGSRAQQPLQVEH